MKMVAKKIIISRDSLVGIPDPDRFVFMLQDMIHELKGLYPDIIHCQFTFGSEIFHEIKIRYPDLIKDYLWSDDPKINSSIMGYPIIMSHTKIDERCIIFMGQTNSIQHSPLKRYRQPSIKEVKFSGPATIVFWSDGDKTIVKNHDRKKMDPEKGMALAIAKKFLGTNKSKSNYYDVFKKFLEEK